MFSPSSKLQHALCRGLPREEADQIFFPPPGIGYKRARKICSGCPDKDECLSIALSFEGDASKEDRFGYWGNCSARERARLAGVEVREEDLSA